MSTTPHTTVHGQFVLGGHLQVVITIEDVSDATVDAFFAEVDVDTLVAAGADEDSLFTEWYAINADRFAVEPDL